MGTAWPSGLYSTTVVLERCARCIFGFDAGIVAQENTFGPEVLGQLHIGQPVADDERVFHIDMAVHIGIQHGRTGLACRQVFMFERTVDVYGFKHNPFPFQGFNHLVVRRPERGFGERIGTEAILIGHHHEVEILLAHQSRQCMNDTRDKFEFFQRIYLLIGLRFCDDATVAVEEKDTTHKTESERVRE